MKKRTLLASVITIVLCISLIAGSTYALFTSTSNVDVSIDSGRVDITAGLTTPVLYSVYAEANGSEFDENGATYNHYPVVSYPGAGVDPNVTLAPDRFYNGGTAALTTRDNIPLISLVNMTPGDKAEFQLTGANTSDVAVQYRYRFDVISGYDLMGGFIVTVDGVEYASLATYTSEWAPLAVNENIDNVTFAVELPVSAGNYYQEKDAEIRVYVEAVQANADVSASDAISVKYITTASNNVDLLSKLNDDEYLHIFLTEDIEEPIVVSSNLNYKTIDADGHNVNLQFGTGDSAIYLDNVVVKNLKAPSVAIKSNVHGNLSIVDSKFESTATASAKRGISGAGKASDHLSVNVENCEFYGNDITESAIYFMNIENLTIRNCKFNDTKSWAIMTANGQIAGNLVVSDCTFNGCTGIMKGAIGGSGNGSLNGNVTFANNAMNNCDKKESSTNSGIFVYINLSPVVGKLSFSNNTVNDVIVTVDDMGMLG